MADSAVIMLYVVVLTSCQTLCVKIIVHVSSTETVVMKRFVYEDCRLLRTSSNKTVVYLHRCLSTLLSIYT